MVDTKLLDGRLVSAAIRAEVKAEVAKMVGSGRRAPKLACLIAGDNPASKVYVAHKVKACAEVGIASEVREVYFDPHEPEMYAAHLEELVRRYGQDDRVSGLLVQLPLPDGVNKYRILAAVNPDKDVDCFVPHNVGLVCQGRPELLPCTPAGILRLLKHYAIPLAGKRVCVINNSDIVGKPLAQLLMQDEVGATVTVCHRQTDPEHLRDITFASDVVVVAVGRPGFLKSGMLRWGTTVVDVGINRLPDGRVVGDCDQDVWGKAAWLTPVPGGVGPMTVAVLLENTVRAAGGY